MFRTFTLLAVGVVGLAGWAGAENRPPVLKVGLPKQMFRDTPPAVVQSAAVPFRELIGQQVGVDGQVEVLDDHNVLATRLKDHTIQVAVFHGFEFAWARQEHPDLIPLAVTVPHSRTCQAALVCRHDDPATKPADLTGRCVVMPTGLRAHCHLFFDRLRDGLSADRCQPADGPPTNVNDALTAVGDGEKRAAVVDQAILAWYADQKPGFHKQFRVLAQSEVLPPAVIAYHKGSITDAQAAKLKTTLVKAHQTGQGRVVLMLWHLKGFGDLPADFEELLATSLKAYPAPTKP